MLIAKSKNHHGGKHDGPTQFYYVLQDTDTAVLLRAGEATGDAAVADAATDAAGSRIESGR